MHNGRLLGIDKEDNKRAVLFAVCLVAMFAIAIGAAYAYLTDSETVKNDFTLDTNLDISLTEPNFNADEAKHMLPAQTIAKDPVIENIGTVDSYVAATVKVPQFSGNILNAEGKVEAVANHDLFSYLLNEGWSIYGEPAVADGFVTYTYVYADALAANQKTAPIFNDVTMANLTQDVGITDTAIDVDAFAIQSHGFDSATDAYKAYLEQNVEGVVAD